MPYENCPVKLWIDLNKTGRNSLWLFSVRGIKNGDSVAFSDLVSLGLRDSKEIRNQEFVQQGHLLLFRIFTLRERELSRYLHILCYNF